MNETITVKKIDLEEVVRDIVGQSHQSLASIQSNSVSDMKTTLAVIMEKQDSTNQHLKELNGKAVTNCRDIEGLKLSETEIKSSLKGGKMIGGVALSLIVILIGIITTLAVYAYEGDKKSLELKTDNIAGDLSVYQAQTQVDNQKIIELLKTLIKK